MSVCQAVSTYIVGARQSLICDPMDCSPQGSSVHRILQARILEWVAILFSRGSNPGLLHCRWIIYHVRHKGSPILLPHNFTHEVLSLTSDWNESLHQFNFKQRILFFSFITDILFILLKTHRFKIFIAFLM